MDAQSGGAECLGDGHYERAHRCRSINHNILIVRSGHCERVHFEVHGPCERARVLKFGMSSDRRCFLLWVDAVPVAYATGAVRGPVG